MSIDIKGHMDRPRQNNGGSAGFGLRLSRKNTDGEWENAWLDVFCPKTCEGIQYVHDGNAKKKVHLVEGFMGVSTYKEESKPQFVCTKVAVEDGVEQSTTQDFEDVPF